MSCHIMAIRGHYGESEQEEFLKETGSQNQWLPQKGRLLLLISIVFEAPRRLQDTFIGLCVRSQSTILVNESLSHNGVQHT